MTLQTSNIILRVCLVLVAGSATADDVNGNFSVRGAGSTQCSQFSVSYDQAETEKIQRIVHWMQGYISARNKLESNTFDTIPVYDEKDLVTLLNIICVKNPNIILEGALNNLVSVFEPTWVVSSSKLSILENSDGNVPIRDAVMAQVQRALTNKGLYKGLIDGTYGSRSAEALKSYQSEKNLTQTSLPDIQTLLSLLVEN